MTSTQKGRKFAAAMDEEEELEGSTEADAGELSRMKSSMMKLSSVGAVKEKGKKTKDLDELKEECSGTEEDQRFGAVGGNFRAEVTKTKISRSSVPSQRKKSKKALFERGTRLLV